MRKLIAFFVVAAVAVTANQAFAQCATCAGSAPTFSQPAYAAPQVFSAPVQSFAAPVESYAAPVDYGTSAPVEYGTPVDYGTAAPIEYGTSAPIEYGTPVASSGCSSCCGGCGSAVGTVVSGGDISGGGFVSGEMSPYSTQGLPAGAVVVSDVVSGEGSTEGTVEGTVESTSVMGSSDAVEPPAPDEDKAVDKLPAEGSASKADGT